MKQSKIKGKKSKRKDDEISESIQPESKISSETMNQEEKMLQMIKKKLPTDYSWLPRVPNTEHLIREEFNSDMLYSGYRPIVVGEKNAKENKLMQFAMKLEKMSEPIPWVSSATGQETFSEWDNVPTEVIKNLRPFQPPNSNKEENIKDKEALEKLQKEIILKEQDKLVNRKRGRKKPVIRLLELKRKFEKN